MSGDPLADIRDTLIDISARMVDARCRLQAGPDQTQLDDLAEHVRVLKQGPAAS